MSIKYHDNTIYPQYGEDHALANNWNPDKDYGNEYVNVYFRMDTKGYDYPDFSFTEEDRAAFNQNIIKVFSSLGWTCEEPKISGACQTWHKGKSNLYLHPQNFSGEVLKNEVKTIAEALEDNNSFKLRWVDLYETFYDITDEEYETILSEKNAEIRKVVLEKCRTKRKTQFYYVVDIIRRIADKFRVPRIGIDDGKHCGIGQTGKHITNIIYQLIEEGYLISAQNNNGMLVRTLNKTEQKQKKLFIA